MTNLQDYYDNTKFRQDKGINNNPHNYSYCRTSNTLLNIGGIQPN